MLMNRLYRNRIDRMLGGVCGGLGSYFGIDPTIVRLIFVISAILTGGLVLLLYVLIWAIVPAAPFGLETSEGFPRSPTSTHTGSPSEGSDPDEQAASFGYGGGSSGFPSYSHGNDHVEEWRQRRRQWAGWALVSFGALILIANLHLLDWLDLHVTWPAFIILAGLALLLRQRSER